MREEEVGSGAPQLSPPAIAEGGRDHDRTVPVGSRPRAGRRVRSIRAAHVRRVNGRCGVQGLGAAAPVGQPCP